jgi:hypothetical protein
MTISSWWLQGAILTYLAGFTILGILAYFAYQEQPPIPGPRRHREWRAALHPR